MTANSEPIERKACEIDSYIKLRGKTRQTSENSFLPFDAPSRKTGGVREHARDSALATPFPKNHRRTLMAERVKNGERAEELVWQVESFTQLDWAIEYCSQKFVLAYLPKGGRTHRLSYRPLKLIISCLAGLFFSKKFFLLALQMPTRLSPSTGL
jgi:hypothetical protein